MKRILIAITALVYFAISTGVVMSVHYCMGRVSGVKVEAFVSTRCACGKSEPMGCCKTEFKVVKMKDDQKIAQADYSINIPSTPVFNTLSLLCTPFFNAPAETYTASHSPPLLSKQDSYLQHCVFRI
jgi:hypothetical protein